MCSSPGAPCGTLLGRDTMSDETIWMDGYKCGRNDRQNCRPRQPRLPGREWDGPPDVVFEFGYCKGWDDEDFFIDQTRKIAERRAL
jgi:hypothetical protein